ncbi:hypothetical protein QO200_18000 [Flavobacterium sp. Arc3]|jgi:DeoR/GlpR family transcriptional regulator of sugar metabolism|uniref:hypothetical protein n=1 Tax=unclassified Flavobacterium TaxID=196869 RepID=UPI00352E0C71
MRHNWEVVFETVRLQPETQFTCKILFSGTAVIHLEFGLSTLNVLDAFVNYTMIKVAKHVVIMAEVTKMNS